MDSGVSSRSAAGEPDGPRRQRDSARTLCTCGHLKVAHEHYRPGRDCSLCDCPRYRPSRGLLGRLFRR